MLDRLTRAAGLRRPPSRHGAGPHSCRAHQQGASALRSAEESTTSRRLLCGCPLPLPLARVGGEVEEPEEDKHRHLVDDHQHLSRRVVGWRVNGCGCEGENDKKAPSSEQSGTGSGCKAIRNGLNNFRDRPRIHAARAVVTLKIISNWRNEVMSDERALSQSGDPQLGPPMKYAYRV